MKLKFCQHALSLIFSILLIDGAAQTIWIANNNGGAVAGENTFTGNNAINDAIAAAANGDINYVIPSGITYSNVTLSKEVSLIGGGFNPASASGATTVVSNINVRAGNSRISGLNVNDINSNLGGPIPNLMIDNCRINNITLGYGGTSVGPLVIQNCILGESADEALNLSTAVTGLRVSNSIIYVYCNSCVSYIHNGLIENCVFIGPIPNYTFGAFNTLINTDVRNCVFYAVRPLATTTAFTDNTFQHNISFNASDNSFSVTSGNSSVNNQVGIDPLFVNLAPGNTFQFSYDLHLQNTSPALGAGVGGTDIGIFGGLTPFDVNGSPLPKIQAVIAPAVTSQGADMTVRIQASGN